VIAWLLSWVAQLVQKRIPVLAQWLSLMSCK